MLDQIKNNPRLKRFVIGLITSHHHPRPRLWVRWFINPFVHKKGKGALIHRCRSRIDVFPWRRFEVGKYALIEDFTVINNGAGDVLIGEGARVGIGSVIIGPVTLGDRVGLGQHVFISGFNHGYSDGTCDSNEQELVKKPIVVGRESHIGANSVIVAGVQIGERVQIGAGSVVTKDIPSYCVAVGNPARIIKRYDFELKQWVKAENSQP
ncbi:MAG: acyltransferase [Alistipes sp.]